jgi:FtsP/CotA-like multicopper oxidase with cupredoxin domain
VRIIVENRLPESTTMHWHGFEIPLEMDGTPYISQKPIAPGEKFVYEFDLHQAGTFFYHSHGAMQEMMGMIGMFIMHPKDAYRPRVDHDFGLILQEWAFLPGNAVPNTANMEFNWLTVNGVSSPMTTPLLVRLGSRVRIRLVNMGWIIIPFTSTDFSLSLLGPRADASRNPPGDLGIPCWSASHRPAILSLKPSTPGRGCCTAIFRTT